MQSKLVPVPGHVCSQGTGVTRAGTRAILDAKAIQPEQTYELQSLGIVLGDAFVQELGMVWAMVEDEHGRDRKSVV